MSQRILIVGLGSIGRRHLRIIRETMPESDIRVLRHKTSSEIPEFSNGCFDSLDDACAFAPQLAVIANPASFHLNVAIPLAMSGVHLLIEKPLSHGTADVQTLLKLVKDKNLILQVGYNLRFLPSLIDFRQRIHQGSIGKVLSVRCEIGQYLPTWRPGTDYREGVSARSELGGGVLLELSHELDCLRWIFGEIGWVNAWIGKLSGLEIDVDDTAHLVLGFSHDSQSACPIATLSMDFIRHDTTRHCIAIGELGSLRWNALTGSVELLLPGECKWQVAYHYQHNRDESYLAQWLHFLSCVETGSHPLVSGLDGQAVLQVIEAAKLSALTQGARVGINK